MMRQEKNDLILYLFFLCTTLFISFMVVMKYLSVPYGIGIDYFAHANSAESILKEGLMSLLKHNPYPLWHIITALVIATMKVSKEYAAAIVTAFFNGLTFSAAYWYLKSELKLKSLYISILTFVLMLLGPFVFPWNDSRYYYWSFNSWHNPTNLAVRPFAILAIIIILKLIEDYDRNANCDTKKLFALSIVMVLSNLAKPNFSQIIIPGLGLYLLVLLIKTKGESFIYTLKIALAFVPAVCLTVLQFILSFFFASYGSGGVMISPFELLRFSLGSGRVWI